MKFFWKDASGVNADIERHCQKESELREKIAELEHEQKDDVVLCVYRNLLDKLLQSKAEAVSKIGKVK